ncbi:MAG: thioredoxin domain-containing protein [Magnetococcales bacterium]|nr:thioredoxin domain-containing protein [Magnetococcales bacterium]
MFVIIIRILLGLLCGLMADVASAENHLLSAISPYLVQQATSPVAWYSWDEAALTQARREQKLIFLSIGYAACLGCRSMDQESFRDPETVALLNAHYVSIRVDREERPDLDGHFMAIVTAMTGSGGWPLNVILTPELQPVYGGSFFPLQPTPEQSSLKTVLTTLQDEWGNHRATLLKRVSKLTAWQAESPPVSPAGSSTEIPDPRPGAVAFWQSRLDDQYGGIGGRESKSPQPLILSLLLRQAARQRQSTQASGALLTLDQMAAGGVRDQLGGAFHRYAVDRRWQVPQFDIMLHDNALLARVYLEAFQLTGRADYALVVREILDDLLRRLRLPGGCFASSLVADKGEGKYYTWSAAEITSVLEEKPAEPFLELFFDPVEGVVAGRSVLRLLGGLETLEQVRRELRDSRQALLAAREKRAPPALDDKVLTSWNGLLISALARAGGVLQEESYLAAARTCLADLNRVFPSPGQLRHVRRGERLGTEVFLDDYAFLAQGLLDLYEADFNVQYLDQAYALMQVMLDHFQPGVGQPLQLTPQGRETAIPAYTVWEDGGTPSGNSVALVTLQRLALFRNGGPLAKVADAVRQGLAGYLAKQAAGVPELLHLWDYQPESAVEVVVVGARQNPETQALLREVRRHLIPGLVLALIEPGQAVDGQAWPLLTGRGLLHDQPTAYVCRKGVCRNPVNRVADLVQVLEGG